MLHRPRRTPNPRVLLLVAWSWFAAGELRADDNHHALGTRDRVRGDLVAGDRDFLVFEGVAGAEVRATVAWEGAEPVVRLYGPSGPLVLDVARSARALRITAPPLSEVGRHVFALSAPDATAYDFRWRVRLPRSQRIRASDPAGNGALVEFEAVGPAWVTLAARGESSYAPRVLEIAEGTGPGKVVLPVTDVRTSRRATRLRFRVERAGTYCATIRDPEGDPGSFDLRVQVRPDRPARRVLDLTGDPEPLGAFRARGVPIYETYGALHRLAVLDPRARAFQESSFDRIGGNDDGLSGNFVTLYQEGAEFVVFDQLGPGVVTRIHYAFRSTPGLPAELFRANAEDYDVRFYFDDEPTPRIAMPVRDFVSGTVPPFLAPAVGDDVVSPGGPYVYVPIPFERRLKITTTAIGHYWQIGYELYDDATGVRSFEPQDPWVGAFNALLAAPGRDPHGGQAFAARRVATLELEPGERADAFSFTGEGWVDSLVFEPLDQTTRNALANTVLRIWFDGHVEPDVDCRLDLFFGSGLGEADVRGLMFAMEPGGTLRCFWPMPFARSCRIELENRTASKSLAYVVTTHYHPVPYGGDWGTFRAQAREVVAPPLNEWPDLQDYIIFDAVGRGHLVGLSLTVGSPGLLGMPQPRTYLEGDEHVWIDGSRTPTHHGTGTEETFNWGWYSAPFTVPFTVPFHGLSARYVEGTADYTANWRVLLGDRIPFRTSLRFGFEQGAEGYEGADYSGVAFAYVREEPAMVETDVFDVGNLTSEAQHAYVSPGGRLLPPLTSQFETQRLEPDFQDGGRSETSAHSFRVAVDPANRGVVLRRVFDQGDVVFARRRARVYVDGRYVRDWYNARWNVWRRFLEDELQLDEEFTSGKSTLTIRIEPTEGTWNAYRYGVHSVLR